MRFSFVTLPDYPLQESLEHIKTADELGFYGCYAADETWHKDLYVLFAAAASETRPDPHGSQPGADRVARADPGRPGGGHPR